MKIYLCLLTIVFLLPSHNSCKAQAVDTDKIVNSLRTCWRHISHEYSTIYGLEEEEVKHYATQKVCFAKDSISTYYGIFYDPKYTVRKVNAEAYAKNNFDCAKQRLGIFVDSVYEVTISSVTKPSKKEAAHKMTDVIVYDEDFIYVVVDGVIFKLIDANRKMERSNSN